MVAAWILAISWHGGPVQQPVRYGRERAHKSSAQQPAHSSLGDCMDEIQYQQKENVLISPSEENVLISKEKELISQTGRSQQLEIPPSLNSKQAACFSSSASFPTNEGFSPDARISQSA